MKKPLSSLIGMVRLPNIAKPSARPCGTISTVARAVLTMGMVSWFICSAWAAQQADDNQAMEIIEAIAHGAKGLTDLGTARIKVTYVKEAFPCASESEIRDVVDEQRTQVTSRFGEDPSYTDRLAAIEHNVRAKVDNHTYERSTMILTTQHEKWRLDHTIDERKEERRPPDNLEGNPFVGKFDVGSNRSRVYTWDGKTQRILFLAEDRLARSGELRPAEGERPRVDQILSLGQIHRSTLGQLLQADAGFQAEVVSENSEAIELRLRDNSDLWRTTIVVAPQYEYALIRMEIEAAGTHQLCENGGYRNVDGVWFPTHVIEEISRTFDGEQHLMERREWTVEDATFQAVIEGQEAVFSPSMPDRATVVDYRFAPPMVYRTDEGMTVADVQIDAIKDVLDRPAVEEPVAVPGQIDAAHGGPGVPSATNPAVRLPSVPKPTKLATYQEPLQGKRYIVLVVALGGLLLAAVGLWIRLRWKRNA